MFFCAENVSGLKLYTEMMNLIINQVVAERPVSQWRLFKKSCWRYQDWKCWHE